MAIVNTTNTKLKYASTCPIQVETATINGTITTAGNASVTVTSRDLPTNPLVLQVPLASGDTASAVATKIKTALLGNADLTRVYNVTSSSAYVVLTRINPSEHDDSLNLAITNGTCAGLIVTNSIHTSAGGTFNKLLDIVSYPDMGSAPSKLDTTTLSDTLYKTYIFGVQEAPDLTFDAYYDKAVYNTINNMNSNYYFTLTFGNSDGRFDWYGQIEVLANGGGVDEVRKMTINLSVINPIVYSIN